MWGRGDGLFAFFPVQRARDSSGGWAHPALALVDCRGAGMLMRDGRNAALATSLAGGGGGGMGKESGVERTPQAKASGSANPSRGSVI